eukprot:CAMPEP_0197730886 /NCGR_PEP_ID=MMETSP1434-20131217/35792_1 /TAXON_ID=265543 /ORGANISM="Minutocellus polymorphus, Strain CCMP3303" /LENGTH=50 /DNA_ID=CAMNT_0043317799 /DNA_START=396 /DNA_END=548 /DNA_ORIENTATION=-
MAEDDEDEDDNTQTKTKSLSNYVRLSRCSARFRCEFTGVDGDMDCKDLIE